MNRTKTNWTVTVLLILGSLLILFPLYMTIAIALKNPQELAKSVLSFPVHAHWNNFKEAIQVTHYFRSFGNSALITISSVVLIILTNSMVGYAIARNMHKRFFKFLYYYFISAMFIPFPIIMLPVVKEMSQLHLANRIGLIILYVVYRLSFNTFVYVGYLKSIPIELEEAALIDGASRWSVFWRVIFPLMKPINATIGILNALTVWNDFMLPLVLLSKPSQMTLPLVQYAFQSKFHTNFNLSFASYLLALLPMILVYIFLQKRIINGVVQGSIK
ncbi:carbohydrate ABC transporter permease [Alicyclobacillus sp. SO9]|uniref:carbohydrate ABC transporter permease n=1 Tax=Alicyclobacillus sp. SO9 TaxID=2665646 RepID=UPI0018E71076|nr:carbohydrate ABC transporter permease [Alicyclobacillus sp. SO9]QQE78722.1 carbohydrate ABC transporter permease [Alicyclobacillus sp. SO9]